MALPSAVTVGSLAVVLAAGAGLLVVADQSRNDPAPAAQTSAPETPETSAPSTTPTTDPPATHQRRHKPVADVVPKTLVDVYNNSGVTGLAADKGAFLRGAGWNVAGTDNWYGDIPANTVYYPPSLRGEARQLAGVLDIGRMRPAVAPMQFDRLTVIFTSA